MYDIIIKNGTIIDGTGDPMFRADIGIKEDVIKTIGDLEHEAAERVIDAEGCYMAPGFIDINNHSDTYWQLFLEPSLESLVYQGVTTIVGGNCGSSLAPLADISILQSIQKWTDIQKINLNWLRMGEFLEEVERHKLSVNFATLVGHGTLRRGLIRNEVRTLRMEESKVEQDMLRQALKDGAWGLSTGLAYAHMRRASREEMTLLSRTVRKHEGVYAFHLRGESINLIRSVEEAILVAKAFGVRLHISHLKAVGKESWPMMEKVLGLIDRAIAEGLKISFDVYPYTHTGSVLYTLLPEWVTEGGKKMMLERLKNPAIRHEVIREIESKQWDYSKAVLINSSLNQMMTKQNIADIANMQDKSPEEVLIDILVASDGRAVASLEVLSEENICQALRHPAALVASNGAGYSLIHAETGNRVHPRSFGTFSRVLGRYTRQEKLFTWEEAIHKMSGKPAQVLGIQNRGILRKGYAADIVVFHPDEVTDCATMEHPYRYSKGMRWVFVNGAAVLEKGVITAKRTGRILRKKTSLWSW